jgi:hypothetical protein
MISANQFFRAIAISSTLLFILIGMTGTVQAAPTSYFNDCGYPEYKPDSLTQYCADASSGVLKIKWSSWTNSQAVGTGLYYVNLCNPSCADGKVVSVTAKVILNGAKVTHGKRYLMNVTVSSANGKPLPGSPGSNTVGWVTDHWIG